ncbi:major acid phosphatase map (histidine-acid phosphatase) [Stylonychia lemnae]|uniref:Major acid phosphatase map (Histidine-acid phosphatase) n=1 Tax=Stylonychia lemnae TaxID=5949 RepID=A0A078AUW8_STYLE|nr:major acid phosphatase map (histidine-acid phosphatase) [Stylonychia lemnae]|eukprot:CDW84663.1 major acid phosphatase map (histidine-acid phosphatase) [Stylonychia lemnae]
MFNSILILLAFQSINLSNAKEQLEMAIEICRHGARSPVDQKHNVSQIYWPRGLGMLTEVGSRQQFELGTELRKRYIDEYKLLDEVYNPEQLLVMSTVRERCFESAQAQLQGLYPPLTQSSQNTPKLTSWQQTHVTLPLSSNDEDFKNFENSDSLKNLNDSPGEIAYQNIPIYVQEEKKDFVLRGFSHKTCPIMVQRLQEASQTQYYQDLLKYYQEKLFIPLSRKLNIQPEIMKWDEFQKMADEIVLTLENGQKLPFQLTEDELKLIRIFMADEFFNVKNYGQDIPWFTSSRLREFIADKMQGKLNNEHNQKFIIMSSHDSVVAMILAALDLRQDEQPKLASTVIFELWSSSNLTSINGNLPLQSKVQWVKLLYNDKELNLHTFCYGSSNSNNFMPNKCDFQTFQQKLSENIYPIEKDCFETQYSSIFQPLGQLDFGKYNQTIVAVALLGFLVVLLVIGKKMFDNSLKKKQPKKNFKGGFKFVETE